MPTLRHIGRRGAYSAAATACATSAVIILIVTLATSRQSPPPPPAAARSTAAAPRHTSAGVSALAYSKPVGLSIPRIGNKRTVIDQVGVAHDGSPALPIHAEHVGWFTGSATPGENGNAVLVGHLDTRTGSAAFYGLGALRPGDRITVHRRDGHAAIFAVSGMSVWPKARFPSERVYGPTPDPQLTLITCADWDGDREAYRSNLVVTAHLIKTTP